MMIIEIEEVVFYIGWFVFFIGLLESEVLCVLSMMFFFELLIGFCLCFGLCDCEEEVVFEFELFVGFEEFLVECFCLFVVSIGVLVVIDVEEFEKLIGVFLYCVDVIYELFKICEFFLCLMSINIIFLVL